ncbi:sulfurtransferase complex subunit TusD [Salinicola aestuarinus]|uniref:sulfurtransferase complex subunit TusD n=1 Tax=Salinicola aestuarinus TaxID=1949082 RepID=UPI000DA22500|nr:sulfurtransferase complex subunit TusD [Salinicola aestuarinus]
MLSYALLVHAAPYSTQGSLSALRFAEAVVARGHAVKTVFFYRDGVHNASTLMAPPQDEVHLGERWRRLHATSQTELLVCVAAGLRRGLVNQAEAKRHDLAMHSVEPPFELTGLGQLVDAMLTHDRLITFAP